MMLVVELPPDRCAVVAYTGLVSHTDYGFEYSDEEPEEEDVDIENQYYNSKGEYICRISAAGDFP